jgi:hypothetical protein
MRALNHSRMSRHDHHVLISRATSTAWWHSLWRKVINAASFKLKHKFVVGYVHASQTSALMHSFLLLLLLLLQCPHHHGPGQAQWQRAGALPDTTGCAGSSSSAAHAEHGRPLH